jgi:hypothetical protein
MTSNAPLSFDDWQGLVAVVAYAPLLLWGPLLGGVTISYWKRRRRDRTSVRNVQGAIREHA